MMFTYDKSKKQISLDTPSIRWASGWSDTMGMQGRYDSNRAVVSIILMTIKKGVPERDALFLLSIKFVGS